MPYPFVGDVDFASVKFRHSFVNGMAKVEIHRDATGGKVSFSACEDVDAPFPAKYSLDSTYEKAGTDRRTQKLTVDSESALQGLRAFDDAVIRTAVENSCDWFRVKTPLDEAAVRAKYDPVLKQREGDDTFHISFKIKTPEAVVPTALHVTNKDGSIAEGKGRIEDFEKRGVKMAPILTAYQIYFLNGRFGVNMQADKIVYTPAEKVSALCDFPSKRTLVSSQTADYEREDEGGEEEASSAQESSGLGDESEWVKRPKLSGEFDPGSM